jgi:F0F1-type ATP synthase alpha subunit
MTLSQVVDADRGPSTKREFLSFEVPAGEDLFGHVVDFLGRPQGSNEQRGTDNTVSLFNSSPTMEMRQQIHEPLMTGVKVSAQAGILL